MSRLAQSRPKACPRCRLSGSGATFGVVVVFAAFGGVAPEIGATFISQKSREPPSIGHRLRTFGQICDDLRYFLSFMYNTSYPLMIAYM